jgi:PleD family two-component response regulator
MLNGIEGRRVNAAALPVADAETPSPGTVLIVTGDGNLGAAVMRVLEQEGLEVVIARHAGHALLAAFTRTSIDVLIADVTLDNMTGESLAAMLGRYHPALRSLYIADRPARHAGRILVRPFTRDELLHELSTLTLPATSQAS